MALMVVGAGGEGCREAEGVVVFMGIAVKTGRA